MSDGTASLAEIRSLIVSALRGRSAEIEQAISTRIDSSVPHSASRDDPQYGAGVEEAIRAVVGYGFDAIEQGPEWSGSVPRAVAAQTRRAARAGVNLGTIQRRYFAGHRELGAFIAQEAERAGLLNEGRVMQHLRCTQEALLEQLAAAVEREYNHERESIGGLRRSELVQRLLSGDVVEPAELAELDYKIDTRWHLALVASGPDSEKIVEDLPKRYGCKCLCVTLNSRACAWLGRPEPPIPHGEHLSLTGRPGLALAVGEPGTGFDGWRLTYDQARAAMAVALRRPGKVTWYSDVRLLAAALQNETLSRSLTQRYLIPLGAQTDGGAKLRRTLRTYIDLECNATSAAHGLKVGRHTVENRVHTAERLIGATLRACLPELDVALKLGELSETRSERRSQ